MTPRAPLPPMSYADAVRDAIRQVDLWQQAPARHRARIMRHIARALGCYPAWSAIRQAIVHRLLAEDAAAKPLRCAA